jgi:hypothetical protein
VSAGEATIAPRSAEIVGSRRPGIEQSVAPATLSWGMLGGSQDTVLPAAGDVRIHEEAIMQILPTISVLSVSVLGLVACATTPTEPPPGGPLDPPVAEVDLEIRHSGAAVAGNSFQCTGTWPSAMTPCNYGWTSQPQTAAFTDGSGTVRLTLRRVPIPVDGGASMVYIDLRFDASGKLAASAQEVTSRPVVAQAETSKPISGWIDPVAMSDNPAARNAGAFSLTFAWGTISGTYDTAPAQ